MGTKEGSPILVDRKTMTVPSAGADSVVHPRPIGGPHKELLRGGLVFYGAFDKMAP
jgi:hypothetical protein